jgi:hypothetical protein
MTDEIKQKKYYWSEFILFRISSIVVALRTAFSRVVFGSFCYQKEQETMNKALTVNN